MRIERFDSGDRMSKFVIHNDTVYLSSQVADENYKNIIDQTINVLKKIDILLQEAGSDRRDILSATIYLKNICDFYEMSSVWDNWIKKEYAPAITCVRADMINKDSLIEISVIAARFHD